MHIFTRKCHNSRCKNFLLHVRFIATVPCKSLRHKSNTFHTILAPCTCLYPSNLRKTVSIKRTKHTRESQLTVSNFMFKMFTIHTNTCTQTTASLCNRCLDDGVVQQFPLPHQTFFQLLYITDPRTVDPSWRIPVHRIQIRRIGWSHLWGMNYGVSAARWQHHVTLTCTMWFQIKSNQIK